MTGVPFCRRLIVPVLALFGGMGTLSAQEFLPPDAGGRGVWVGLAGFSTRLGYDFSSDQQAVLGVALDLGDLGSPRVRLRPSFEVGFGDGPNTYVTSAELLVRLTEDTETAVPYVGLGGGLFTQEGCGEAEGCPALWLQFALGFEIRLRDQINWFVEYHAEDAFSRQRIFLGLATRRGG